MTGHIVQAKNKDQSQLEGTHKPLPSNHGKQQVMHYQKSNQDQIRERVPPNRGRSVVSNVHNGKHLNNNSSAFPLADKSTIGTRPRKKSNDGSRSGSVDDEKSNNRTNGDNDGKYQCLRNDCGEKFSKWSYCLAHLRKMGHDDGKDGSPEGRRELQSLCRIKNASNKSNESRSVSPETSKKMTQNRNSDSLQRIAQANTLVNAIESNDQLAVKYACPSCKLGFESFDACLKHCISLNHINTSDTAMEEDKLRLQFAAVASSMFGNSPNYDNTNNNNNSKMKDREDRTDRKPPPGIILQSEQSSKSKHPLKPMTQSWSSVAASGIQHHTHTEIVDTTKTRTAQKQMLYSNTKSVQPEISVSTDQFVNNDRVQNSMKSQLSGTHPTVEDIEPVLPELKDLKISIQEQPPMPTFVPESLVRSQKRSISLFSLPEKVLYIINSFLTFHDQNSLMQLHLQITSSAPLKRDSKQLSRISGSRIRSWSSNGEDDFNDS